MPVWLLPVGQWLGERFLHLVIYGSIILGIGFFLYSSFLKPTNKTIYTQPVTQKYDQSHYAPFSCAKITKG